MGPEHGRTVVAVAADRIVVRSADAARNEHVVFDRHIARQPGVILHPDAIADSRVVIDRDVTSDDSLRADPRLFTDRGAVTDQGPRAERDVVEDYRVRSYRTIGADIDPRLETRRANTLTSAAISCDRPARPQRAQSLRYGAPGRVRAREIWAGTMIEWPSLRSTASRRACSRDGREQAAGGAATDSGFRSKRQPL